MTMPADDTQAMHLIGAIQPPARAQVALATYRAFRFQQLSVQDAFTRTANVVEYVFGTYDRAATAQHQQAQRAAQQVQPHPEQTGLMPAGDFDVTPLYCHLIAELTGLLFRQHAERFDPSIGNVEIPNDEIADAAEAMAYAAIRRMQGRLDSLRRGDGADASR